MCAGRFCRGRSEGKLCYNGGKKDCVWVKGNMVVVEVLWLVEEAMGEGLGGRLICTDETGVLVTVEDLCDGTMYSSAKKVKVRLANVKYMKLGDTTFSGQDFPERVKEVIDDLECEHALQRHCLLDDYNAQLWTHEEDMCLDLERRAKVETSKNLLAAVVGFIAILLGMGMQWMSA
ncbi:hypothetical protein Cgig2_013222 [Carnegiea gigantea]|uniref:Transmembrane protein n=1 Tax=Carnegiea gigantea TaxID=171969 RepID=A0A9Q1KLY1_9CARY|nr:hypothetical protein Cgig2_013222 [Carnegiea gigantea]